jgi:hypothetical protein
MSGGPALTGIDPTGIGTVVGEMSLSDYRYMYVPFQGIELHRLYRYLTSIVN